MFGGGGRGNKGRGGRHSGGGRGQRGGGGGGRSGDHEQLRPKHQLCKYFVVPNLNCNQGDNCKFSHALKSHIQLEASSEIKQQKNNGYNNNYNNNNQKRKHTVSSAAIWENQGMIKIFTGSNDGFWRLWNSANGFTQEFEKQMSDGGKVNCVEVASNFLFCGFDGICPKLPNTKVGMIHAWNLSSPQDPPLEFYMEKDNAPYAHSFSISSLFVTNQGIVLSGSEDSTIKVWQFENNAFTLRKTLAGHVRAVTGMTVVSSASLNMLWSCSVDETIRLWDLNTGDCKHLISSETTKNQQTGQSAGHQAAITSLINFESKGMGNFVLSGSFDGTIKAWGADNGNLMASSEPHGNLGIVSMCLSSDTADTPLILCGLENGCISVRNILQTQNAPAFTLLLYLNEYYSSHSLHNAIKCIVSGPSNTFYSCGDDGKMIVWQITGQLV